jgi:hypothetical protein
LQLQQVSFGSSVKVQSGSRRVKLADCLWHGLHDKDGDQGKFFGNKYARQLFIPRRPRYCSGGLPVHVV